MGLPGFVVFLIILVVVLAAIFAGYIIFTHVRARRLGLPTPSLSSYNPFANSTPYNPSRSGSGGIVGWVNDKISSIRNRGSRSAGGAYEEPLGSFGTPGRTSRRGFGALDPDDAWDARVGTEADAYGPGGYYEEAEVGLHGDTGYAGNVHAGEDRGRAPSRERDAYIGGSQKGLDRRYDEEMGTSKSENPFDDDAEVSLRGVSPRPHEGRAGDSPTERRSMFTENV